MILLFCAYAGYVYLTASKPPAREEWHLTAGFAGSAACAECHRDLHLTHSASPHAHALRAASDPSVLEAFPEPRPVTDPDSGTVYQMRVTGDRPEAGVRALSGTVWVPMLWAFGSGTQAITPVGQQADGQWVESALTYYRNAGWDFTVGFLGNRQRLEPNAAPGTRMAQEDIFACFGCHTAGLQRKGGGIDLTGVQLGVQCESCHGPSAAHIDAARGNRRHEGTQTPGQSSGQSMVTFCATCHRDSPPPGLKVTDPVVIRFAPVGFQQSRCFQARREDFSCVTCHDPHGTSSKDPGFYRAICLKCHEQPASSRCPVQPLGNCVSCHMPKQIVQRNAIFTDHWIRVPKEASGH